MTSMSDFWKDALGNLSSKFALAGLLVCIIFGIAFCSRYIAQGVADDYIASINPAGIEEPMSDQDVVLSNNFVNPAQVPDSSFIYDVSIKDLANADSYMDKQTVQVTGEVVGDRISAEDDGDYCWIMLQSLESDDEVSVYMSKAMSDAIDTYGAYGKHGTTIQVRGTFYLASDAHQGASELQAESLSVVSKGFVDELPFHPSRMMLGVVLLAIGCALVILFNFLRERRR